MIKYQNMIVYWRKLAFIASSTANNSYPY